MQAQGGQRESAQEDTVWPEVTVGTRVVLDQQAGLQCAP